MSPLVIKTILTVAGAVCGALATTLFHGTPVELILMAIAGALPAGALWRRPGDVAVLPAPKDGAK